MPERLRLKPYEDPDTLERLRGATGMTYTYGNSPGWTLLVLASDGAGDWITFDNDLTALGVFRQRDWLTRHEPRETRVVPTDG